MRKFIIDTDTASDDAAAIMLAALDNSVELLGVTTVVGNVPRRQSADNAIATLEACDVQVPVYMGAIKPLFNERKETISVHGKDGMGDCDLIHPVNVPDESVPSYQFILDMVRKYPGEVEIVALGPVTNVALAIMAEPELMMNVKHIWSMGTPGLGAGNATPVSEFNVYIDAEAYQIMLNSGIPVTIAGFDLCMGEIELDENELSQLARGNKAGRFLERATSKLLEYNITSRNSHMVDLPDAVALAAALWPEFIKDHMDCHGSVITLPGETYGQVIFYKKGATYESCPKIASYNHRLITMVDEGMFTKRFMEMLTRI